MLRCILLVSVVTNSLYAGNGCSSCAGVKTPTTKKYTVQPAPFKLKTNERSAIERPGLQDRRKKQNSNRRSTKDLNQVVDPAGMLPIEETKQAAAGAQKEPQVNRNIAPQEAPVSPTFVAVTPTSTTIRIIS